MFLAFVCSKGFKVYQMDVESILLDGYLKEEAYIKQLEGFDLSENKDYACKLKEALYGLKQALRAWYVRLDHYLQQKGFKRGVVGKNIYIEMEKENLLITLAYVDDLIFGRNDNGTSHGCALEMSKEFEMSMIGELSFFLLLQVSHTNEGIFVSQTKYLKEMLKWFGMEECAPISTPMITKCKLSKDDESPKVNSTLYRYMIGSLLYLIDSRSCITQAIEMIASFN